jgi:hypothetical protein
LEGNDGKLVSKEKGIFFKTYFPSSERAILFKIL